MHYEHPGVVNDNKQLLYLLNFCVNLADAYTDIVAMGGKVVPELQAVATSETSRFRGIATALLVDIAEETKKKLEHRLAYLWCPNCLTRFAAHPVRLSLLAAITYYGCGLCKQSQDFWIVEGPVVAVLDQNMTDRVSDTKGTLRVNWFGHGHLFDFTGVEIIQATDEEVERFAIKLGNDMDELRRLHYREMRCQVSPLCPLSDNTMRILHRTFGEVEIKQ